MNAFTTEPSLDAIPTRKRLGNSLAKVLTVLHEKIKRSFSSSANLKQQYLS